MLVLFVFFFITTSTTEIYTLSLHDALPISRVDDLPEHFTREPHHRSHDDRVVQLVHVRSEEHTSELQSHSDLVCRLLLEKKKKDHTTSYIKSAIATTYKPQALLPSTTHLAT